jgi:hypothetical protein
MAVLSSHAVAHTRRVVWRVLPWLLVAACFKPASFEPCAIACTTSAACPDDLACVEGRCTTSGVACPPADGGGTVADAAIDAPDADGGDGCPATPPMFTGMLAPLHDGTSYTPGTANAVYLTNNGLFAETPLDGDGTALRFIVPAQTHDSHRSPRLAPTGDEVFFGAQRSSSETQDLLHSRFDGQIWGPPTPVTLSFLASAAIIPGTPSQTTPRRMIIQIDDVVDELVEASPDNWVVTPVPELASMTVIDPNLTPDGLHVVFVGQGPTGFAVMIADRVAVTEDFGTPRILLGVPATAILNSPVLSKDCSVLYVSMNNVVHRIPPPPR